MRMRFNFSLHSLLGSGSQWLLILVLGLTFAAAPTHAQQDHKRRQIVGTSECISKGNTPPATGKYPEVVQNGDFRVTGNSQYKRIGDALNEQTRWTCSTNRGRKYFENHDIAFAVLTITLITGEDGWPWTDGVGIDGFLIYPDPKIQGRKANSRITVDIDLLEHYKASDILNELIENNGNLNLIYWDDATVSYAMLRLGFAKKASLKNILFVKNSKNQFLEIKEISYGEPFYIKAEFDSEPEESKKTVTLDWGEGTSKPIVVEKQDGNPTIYLSDAIYAKRPE